MSFPRYPEYKDSGVEWLGEVPAHWRASALRHLATLVTGITPPTDEHENYDHFGFPWIRPEDINEQNKATTASKFLSDKGARLVRKIPAESVLICCIGTIGKVGITNCIASTNQQVTAALFAGCKKFFYYSAIAARAELETASTGNVLRILNSERLGRIVFPEPPEPEQSSIAAFLDRETTKIDALVAEQQNLIALLKEKRQALISHAVTKGLDPDVPMKDSGAAWLGEVPAHWVVLMLSRVASERCDGPFGSGIKSEHYTDSGALVVRLQNIRSRGFYVGEPAFLELEYFEQELKRHEVVSGDLLIAGLGDENNIVGRACVAPDGISPALVKADCFRFRLNEDVATSGFVAAQLNVSAVADAGRLANGSTRSRIPLSVMATRLIALPPLAEQFEIIAFVERERSAIDELVNEADATIALLQERRTALISAAVTGKIDVRHLSVASADPTPEPA